MISKNSIIGIFIVALLGMGFYTFSYYSTTEDITITVTNTERIVESDADNKTTSKYLVFTTNETFENTDALFLGKWNSSDVQGALKTDSTYSVHVIGWRLPFFSMYRNIVSINN